jgi:hypothetical protein
LRELVAIICDTSIENVNLPLPDFMMLLSHCMTVNDDFFFLAFAEVKQSQDGQTSSSD